MGRSQAPLDADRLEQALAYLQRALDRKAPIFTVGLKATARSLASLRKAALTQRGGDFAQDANRWLLAYLTTEGRKTMMAALRRAAADQEGTKQATLRVPRSTHERLARLAAERGVSLPDVIEHLLATAPTGTPPTSQNQ